MAESRLKRPEKKVGPTIQRKGKDMAGLIAELLHATTKTHMAHLKSKSYAAHMALGEFYETLPDMVDNVAEQYQGVTGSLLEFPTVTVTPINTTEEAIAYLGELYTMIAKYQETCMYSEIINELDVIKSCIDKAKYKLIFLK